MAPPINERRKQLSGGRPSPATQNQQTDVSRPLARVDPHSGPSLPHHAPISHFSSSNVHYLQRTAGNRAVSRLLSSIHGKQPLIQRTNDPMPHLYDDDADLVEQHKYDDDADLVDHHKYDDDADLVDHHKYDDDADLVDSHKYDDDSDLVNSTEALSAPPVLASPPKNLKKKKGKGAPPKTKYKDLYSLKAHYSGEHKDSLAHTMQTLFNATPEEALKLPKSQLVAKALTRGWTEKDVNRLLKTHALKVRYLRKKKTRNQFKLNLGSTITQGDEAKAWDTSDMWANGVGNGHGIFVMDGNGNFYGHRHKVGKFHHSSFLAGGDVAAAGTMKADKGKLKLLTNKTGHYQATEESMYLVVRELSQHGISPASYHVGVVSFTGKLKFPGTGQQLLDNADDVA